MRVVHDDGRNVEVLADDVTVASTIVERMRGLMFRPSLEPGDAMVFEFDGVATRGLHSVFVFSAFDAIWVQSGTVDRVKRFPPMRGIGWATADLIVELPPGRGASVEPGDSVRVESSAV